MNRRFNRCAPLVSRLFTLAILVLFTAVGARAQKNKKNQTPAPQPDAPAQTMPMSPGDELDHDIGEMLGALQIGNLEIMHKYYADNATFVSSSYAPPIVGWKAWSEGYERQKAAFRGMQVVRRNTLIFPHGDTAWATYQWEFSGTQSNGTSYFARGQTTLVFNRVGSNWMIVHNHTSVDCSSLAGDAAAQPAAPASAAPAPTAPPKQ